MKMHHQRFDQTCIGDNFALNTKRLDKNNVPRPGDQHFDQACPGDMVAQNINNMPEIDALAGRPEQGGVKSGEESFSLPTHTASCPYPAKLSTAQTHHQRVDQARPGENVRARHQGSAQEQRA